MKVVSGEPEARGIEEEDFAHGLESEVSIQ